MARILCIGQSAYDITVMIEQFPIENRKYSTETLLECGGGPAGNAAYLLGKWGMDCAYAGILGDDSYGNKLKKEYKDIGVDLKYLVVDDNSVTPVSIIIANKSNGSRTLFNHSKNNSKLKVVFDEKDEPEIILVDGHELDASIEAIRKYPKAKSILDAGCYKANNIKLAKLVDYLVCSEDFARDFSEVESLYSEENIKLAFRKLEELNKNNVIITIGENGCLYKENGKVVNQATYKVDAIDTTGAGDIFHGAFAYCITKDYDMKEVLKISSIAAALSVSKIGGRVSIPAIEDVLKTYKKGVI